MKAYQANLVNALVLIGLGLWGYFSAGEEASATAFIPVGFGAVFLAATPGIRRENRIVAHVVVLLTAVLLVMLLAVPLPKRMQEGDTAGTVRVAVMAATCALAMVFFVKSFIDARRAKKAE